VLPLPPFFFHIRLDTSLAQSKVDLLHASIWLSLGAGLVTPLGGYATYTHLIHEVTLNGAATDNLTFVWLLLLLYYTVKGGVMSLATGWRALSAHAAEPELLQDLEQLQVRLLLLLKSKNPIWLCGYWVLLLADGG
jgi:hypothetical protein